MTVEETSQALVHAAIAQQNDLFRQMACGTPKPENAGLSVGLGKFVLTQGVAALPEDAMTDLLKQVGTFDTFTQDNDSYGERAVYGLLFKASAQTVMTIAADPKRLGARVGITSVLHT